jgi:hypothetical protein
MTYKFWAPHSDEEVCGEPVQTALFDEPLICLRIKGHKGDHETIMRLAAELDKVCWDCRSPEGSQHKDSCQLFKD